jgi:hypothetical protein
MILLRRWWSRLRLNSVAIPRQESFFSSGLGHRHTPTLLLRRAFVTLLRCTAPAVSKRHFRSMTSSPLDPSKPVDVLMAKADPNDKENFCPAVSAEEQPSVQPAAPQLSSAEIETWGVMAEKMAYFHE